ncbi:protein naked cuticle [Bactrocera dorsalis]|uniref:Protein naked cuticle homolog n=1 Tax=Bactrocera dorsalis TaxID=27457 RepID=A0A6I9UQD3_BACDO|nr:protein naked cuticle [Bactrocera dorsalis]
MAGNIVKWWKHKILGGYKQFSVQECTTDSEELMYHQVRASSSCSAPPDLLMVSDRENNIPLRSPVVNLISTATTTTAAAHHHSSAAVGCSSVPKHHHATGQQQQHATHRDPHQQHGSKDDGGKQHLKLSSKSAAAKFINTQQQLAVSSQQQQQHQYQDEIDGPQQTSHQRHSSHQHGKEERIRLEEFTCDVSVEGGKSTQPLQFSFTFYDLDGHHGKITKDDIVGIVYTIYESIGKSVVVPHCGSKTINVRLTVSPEGKSKSAAAAAAAANGGGAGGGGGGGKLKKTANGAGAGILDAAIKSNAGHGHGHTRRQHRYRPRKLIKSDDEDDDSNSDKEKEAAAATNAPATTTSGALAVSSVSAPVAAGVGGKSKGHSSGSKFNKMKASAAVAEQQQMLYQQQQPQEAGNAAAPQQQHTPPHIDASAASCPHESLYENMTSVNLKCCSTKDARLKIEDCRGCEPTVTSAPITPAGYVRSSTDVYMRQASTRVKMLRKARKQKFQDHCHETRQRSLSVGNEACWYNRHIQQQQQQSKLEQSQQQQQLSDVVDGVQLRNPQKNTAATASSALAQRQRNSTECWKTALNRNDLMSIIRESMEKNRLCFQMSGKPQANVSPIRQPQLQHQPPHNQQQPQQQQQQRSNTASKIPTLIANHSNAIISHSNSNNNNNNHHHHHHHSPNNSHSHSNSSSHSHSSNHTNNNSSELNLHDISTTNNTNTTQYHPQPHIPIYHQQMAINPAVLAAQSGMQHGGHGKMNLCGYDSFLHATICGGGTSHSPPLTTSGNVGALTATTFVPQIVGHDQHTNQQQLIATVQPIMNAVPSSQSTPAKVFLNSTTHQIKTSKILRSGSYSQQLTPLHSLTAHNSPQYSGYQRLLSSNAHHSHGHGHGGQNQQLHQQCANKLAALSLGDASLAHNSPVEHIEKWLKNNSAKHQRKDSATKYADNALYAKLSEKLQESALSTHNQRENVQRRKHKSAHKSRTPQARHTPTAQPKSACASNGMQSSSSNTSIGTYAALIPIHGDPAECENLIAPTTTDDEAVNEAPTALFYATCKAAATSTPKSNAAANAAVEPVDQDSNVATAKLVDITDETELVAVEAVESAVDDLDVTLRVSDAAEVEELDAEEGEEDEEEAETEESGSASAANTSGGASSLIHRYVHEHIHHHYHHFEEKDE